MYEEFSLAKHLTILALAVIAIMICIHVFTLLISGSKKTRKDALKKYEIKVSDIKREVLVSNNAYEDPKKKEKVSVKRYAIPHNSKYKEGWEFIQVIPDPKNKNNEFGEYYQLNADHKVPKKLKELLIKFINDFDADYYEFEKTSEEIILYLEEWGGRKRVEQLYKYMKEIREIEEMQ